MLANERGRTFVIGTDRDFKAVRRLRDIRFLIWNSDLAGRCRHDQPNAVTVLRTCQTSARHF